MKNKLPILFIFLLILTAFSFFGAQFLNKSLVNYATFLCSFIAVIVSIPYFFIKKYGGFVLPVRLIVVSIIISIFTVYFSWGQQILATIVPIMPLLLWIFFFYLLRIEIPVSVIENIVLVYGVIYLLLYFYQFTHAQTVLFGIVGEDSFDTERGIVRIIFPGGGIFFLAVFIAVNRLTTDKKKKWFWLLLTVLGLIIPVMQATRQFIAGVLIVYIYHFVKEKNLFQKLVIIAFSTGIVCYIAQLDIPVIKGLIQTQEETSKEGNNNIRLSAADFFLTRFSPNGINKVLGNGVPAAPNLSSYGNYVSLLQENGYFMEDLGIIGLYTMFGILAVLAYVIIWIKSFVIPLPEEFYYVKYYLWFLLITSLTSNTLYHSYYLLSTVFALYIYQVKHVYEYE